MHDVDVYIGHFHSLLIFYHHIIKELCVFRIMFYSLIAHESVDHQHIGFEGCSEIDKIGFEFVQVYQIGIFCLVVYSSVFYILSCAVDVSEQPLIFYGYGVEGADIRSVSVFCTERLIGPFYKKMKVYRFVRRRL